MSKKFSDDFDFDEDTSEMFQDDDYEAAFWDEFFYSQDKLEEKDEGRTYTIKIVDEETGEEQVFEGVKLRKKKSAH